MYGIIYKATNKVNGKIYIGQTTRTLEQRKWQHVNSANNGRINQLITRAINKYGDDNFNWEVIDTANSREELNDKEIFYIKEYKTFVGFNKSNGYNMTLGGESLKGESNPMFGRTHDDESISLNRKNQPNVRPVVQLTEDGKFVNKYPSVRKASEVVGCTSGDIVLCCSGRAKTVATFIWIYKDDYSTENVKNKVEEAKNKRKPSSVIQLTKEGDFIAEFETIAELSKAINGDISAIVKCCKGKLKTHKGFKFAYKEDAQ